MPFPNKRTEECFKWHKVFVCLWQQSNSLAEFCAIAAVNPRQASNTAANLRRRGVALKNMPAGGQSKEGTCLDENDIYELNRIVDQMEETIKAEKVRKKVSRAG